VLDRNASPAAHRIRGQPHRDPGERLLSPAALVPRPFAQWHQTQGWSEVERRSGSQWNEGIADRPREPIGSWNSSGMIRVVMWRTPFSGRLDKLRLAGWK
jgi:hypothetical protein